MFLETLLERKLHPATIKNYVTSIRAVHKRKDIDADHLYHQQITDWLKGMDNLERRPFKPQPYIKRKQLRHIIIAAKTHRHPRLMKAMIALAYHSMLRISNLTSESHDDFDHTRQLCREDVTFTSDAILINLRWSKTLQHIAQATTIAVPATNDPWCPRRHLLCYFNATADRSPATPLFATDEGHYITPDVYRAYLTQIHKLAKINITSPSHAYRRGGAVFYYKLGLPIHEIKRLGTWKSDTIFTYIRNCVHSVKPFKRAFKRHLRSL